MVSLYLAVFCLKVQNYGMSEFNREKYSQERTMMKFLHNFKQHINNLKEWFALLGLFAQLGIVLLIGFVIVMISGLLTGSIKNSYLVFIDPSSLTSLGDNVFVLLFAFILMFLGLALTGFIISVLSSWLENVLRDIKSGRLDYKGNGHTIIINTNETIYKILEELNLLYKDNKNKHEVVLILNDIENIELLQFEIKNMHLENIDVHVRYGNVLSWERYLELSILKVHSIIILSDTNIKDEFIRDNQNLRILNLLCSKPEFVAYLQDRKSKYIPVKSIIEFTYTNYFDKITENVSHSLFVAIAPKDVLSNILNLSVIDIDFFNIWSELLSFEGHELYFVDAKRHGLINSSYKEALLRQKNGLLIGLSRTEDEEFKILLNKQDEVIKEGDWLIMIAKTKYAISFSERPLKSEEKVLLQQPKETFVRNIVQVGEERVLSQNGLLEKGSSYIKLVPNMRELFDAHYFDRWIYTQNISEKPDKIIINLQDEVMYRLAMNLKVIYSQKELEQFVFLVDDVLIADQLFNAGFTNTILSNILFAKYIAQVSNQLALHRVFAELFQKEGSEINFIETAQIPHTLLQDIDKLKAQLIENNMVYLGVVHNDNQVEFEALESMNTKKIIVLSDGKY